jgi:hypothetical protein
MCISIYVCVLVYMYVYQYICMCISMCMCISIYVYVYVCVCVCICICIYVYACVCIYVYVYAPNSEEYSVFLWRACDCCCIRKSGVTTGDFLRFGTAPFNAVTMLVMCSTIFGRHSAAKRLNRSELSAQVDSTRTSLSTSFWCVGPIHRSFLSIERVKCITIIDTIIHHILHIHTNDAHT